MYTVLFLSGLFFNTPILLKFYLIRNGFHYFLFFLRFICGIFNLNFTALRKILKKNNNF